MHHDFVCHKEKNVAQYSQLPLILKWHPIFRDAKIKISANIDTVI